MVGAARRRRNLNAEFLASLRDPERTARDIMSAPVVTVGEETEVGEIARLLAAHRIKRVPVVRDGRIIGIVSRADLLRALAGRAARLRRAVRRRTRIGAVRLGRSAADRHGGDERGRAELAPASDPAVLRADDFRRARVQDFERGEPRRREEARRAAAQ